MLDLTDWQNKKFTNKNGAEAVILTIDAPGPQPIVGYLKYSTSDVDGITVCAWHRDGHFHTAEMSGMDLVNAKTKHEGWANLYRVDYKNVTLVFFDTKEHADRHDENLKMNAVLDAPRIACVRIEWEE